MARTLLFEIGVEELPATFVDAALDVLPELAKAECAALRLEHGAIHALGTPRRLALLVEDLADKQADLDEELVGPAESVAFKDGTPTKAAEAFAAKCGIAVSELNVVELAAQGKQKAGRYLTGRRQVQGVPAAPLLGAALLRIAQKIPFRKSMRWGEGAASFGRPVQWLVALFGDELISVTFAGVTSGRETRGHRFLAPAAFGLAHADGYRDALRSRHVIVDRTERRDLMMQRVAEAAARAGGKHDDAELLVVENASMVEEPFIVIGEFEREFLELPAGVIRSVARGHQRYFCVETGPDTLTPHYIAVANTALQPDNIAKGMNRVMRARLSDARFFYREDLKTSTDTRNEKLRGVVFHNKLGTVWDKKERLRKLVAKWAPAAGITGEELTLLDRAADTCKADLTSLMVGEFPELQGHMGRAYAHAQGRPVLEADALRDHYMPIGADGPVSRNVIAALIALADRLDTLVGCFGVGLSPTGAADPFALRRNCIAALRILIETPWPGPAMRDVQFSTLLGDAHESFDGKLQGNQDEVAQRVLTFAAERFRGILANATTDAVAAFVLGAAGGETAQVERPLHTLGRAEVVARAIQGGEPWLGQARTVQKRLAGISKEAKPVLHDALNAAKPDDAKILEVVRALVLATDDLSTAPQTERAYAHAGQRPR
jgi:glycyl-tRNA synthetase beta chain